MPDADTIESTGARRSFGQSFADRLRSVPVGVWLLAAVAYLPLLLTKPGQVGADTKTYLYLDPSRLLSRAPYMWDTNIGLGTVTHQNIGYIWPMGPYYWVLDTIGVPDWLAQRLWLGSIILLAGLGVRWMMKELRWDGGGATVAAFAYALSPYLLDYAARISVILLPFVGLPWLIGLAARSIRRQDWRWPAVFALVALTVGGVNATSLLLVMVGPILWFVYAVFVAREATFRDALKAGLRITVLTAATSTWWVAGLMLQGGFGIPILRYTETYETVATAALAPELLRGLGYWFFYGRDAIGTWTLSTVTMVQFPPVLLASFLIPGLSVLGGLLVRWKHRVFFAAIIVVGLIMGIGSHPWDSPSPFGAIFQAWSRSDMGLSFRSTPRAVPLIALGLAVFLGAGVAALARWRPKLHLPIAAALIALICFNQIALFRGQMVDRNIVRDEQLPEYWLEAADALSAGDHDTRTLEIPGIDFAAYRWGNTVDPITPGLTDRPYAARELIPYGSPPSANLLNEFDQPFQAGRVDPATINPIAQMLGVGDIVLRGDLQYERYLSPRPRTTFNQLGLAGLGDPVGFGEAAPNEPMAEIPLDDEHYYATPAADPDPWPVTIFPVTDPRPMNRAVQASAPVLLAGDATGLVGLASSGALQVDRPLFYSASFADDPAALADAIDQSESSLVVTDTNRRQARRWGSVRENDGFTERAGETAVERDNTDNRLELFPGESDDDRTVTVATSGPLVRASDYGNAVTYTPGDRAANAMDGTESSSWRVAAFEKAEGHYLDVTLVEPVTADHLSIRQIPGERNRYITAVDLVFDGGEPERFELGEASRQEGGQTLDFGERTFSHLQVVIATTDLGILPTYRGVGGVGISELTIPGVDPVREVIRPPTSLLDAAGADSIDRPLSYVFSRRAANPADVNVSDEETSMMRLVEGPVARSFTPFGHARLNPELGDSTIDALLGLPSADEGGVTADSSARMPGMLSSRASLAVDGDPSTATRTPVNHPLATLDYRYGEPVTVDGLDLELVTDGKHSVPTVLDVSVDGGSPVRVELPDVGLGDGNARGTTTTVRAETGPLTGESFRVSIVEVREAISRDWFGGGPVVLPVGIAEVGLPVVAGPDAAAPFTSECRTDLATIDGEPIPLRITGTVGDAESLSALQLEACDGPVEVPAGSAELITTPGATSGFDIDLFALASAAGGGAGADTLQAPPGPGPKPPESTPSSSGRLTFNLDVKDAEEPYWAVLGQSYSPGWTATTTDGHDLGEPTLINGYANGWLVDPAVVGSDATIVMKWTPQTLIWAGLGTSALGLLLCIGLIVANPGRRRREGVDAAAVAVSRPVGQLPWESDPVDTSMSLPVLAAKSIGVGIVAAFFGGIWVGLALLVATPIALRLARGQLVVRVASAVLIGGSFVFIIAKQLWYRYQVDFEWVRYFEATHAPTIAGVFLLLLAAVADQVRGAEDS